MRYLLFLALFACMAAPELQAGGRKKPGTDIAFHMETEQADNPKLIFPQFVAGEERAFRRIPEISAKDIAAFNPFPSRDGDGFGVVVQVKAGAKNRLSAVTAANLNRWLVARVNGRIVDAVLIDSQIADGQLVIWKGLSATEVQELDKTVPRIGEKKPRG